ncbi:MAG: hypothetical protein HQL06_06630 [Nitrospirae bacterium]|nr:hypothetical protein [Nitrospirota bacterium]
MSTEQDNIPQGQNEINHSPQDTTVNDQPQVSQPPEGAEDAQKPKPFDSSKPQHEERQDIGRRIFSSPNAGVGEHKRMRALIEDRIKHWMNVYKATDIARNLEDFERCKLNIDLYTKELNELDAKIRNLEEEAELKTKNTSESRDTTGISNRMREAFDRDKIFAILVVMFPQMEWSRLEEIFNEVVERIGNVPTVAQQKAERNSVKNTEANRDSVKSEVLPRQSIFDERLGGILERLDAHYSSVEVAGEHVEVIRFNNMPDMEGFIRRQYRDIILLQVIKALFELVAGRTSLRLYERQQIGYAIGGFIQLGTSKIYDYIKQYWANSDFPHIRATIGYLLSRALETGLSPDNVSNFLKGLIDSNNSNFQWAAASVCKEIGSVKIELALDVIRHTLKRKVSENKQNDVGFVLDAVVYSLVALGLDGFYRNVLMALSQWIKEEEDPELRKVQITLFIKTLDVLISRVITELSKYGKLEIGKEKNFESKSLEALWMNFTQSLQEDVKMAIIVVLVTIIRSPSDIVDILISHANVELLGAWLDAFLRKDDKKTYEPMVRIIVEDLLISVYEELSACSKDKQAAEKIQTRRIRVSTIQTGQAAKTSDFQQLFWALIEPWKQAPIADVRKEVFNVVEKRIKAGGTSAKSCRLRL